MQSNNEPRVPAGTADRLALAVSERRTSGHNTTEYTVGYNAARADCINYLRSIEAEPLTCTRAEALAMAEPGSSFKGVSRDGEDGYRVNLQHNGMWSLWTPRDEHEGSCRWDTVLSTYLPGGPHTFIHGGAVYSIREQADAPAPEQLRDLQQRVDKQQGGDIALAEAYRDGWAEGYTGGMNMTAAMIRFERTQPEFAPKQQGGELREGEAKRYGALLRIAAELWPLIRELFREPQGMLHGGGWRHLQELGYALEDAVGVTDVERAAHDAMLANLPQPPAPEVK